MKKQLKNIILVSPDVTFASNIANYLCSEYGFIHHKIGSRKKVEGYVVSTCSEVIDAKRVAQCGYVIDISKFRRHSPQDIADKIFDEACAHFDEQEKKSKCA